jgi:ribosomal protein S18 acetylase RimI-like enzyme
MSNIEIFSIDATHHQFDDAVRLFDQYRQFYGQAADAAQCQRFLRDRLTRGESTLFLATVQNQVAGLAQLYSGFSSIQCSQTVTLNDLYVNASYRTIGLGRMLVEASIRFAKAQGATSIQLETALDNEAAQRLYQRLGFVRSIGFVPFAQSLKHDRQEVSA